MGGFGGVPLEAVDFYEELELNNSREWWVAHRVRYDTAVRAPMEALAAALEDEFGPVKLFRPNRDVRFSADKSPYKTHQGVVVATASGMGWYVAVSAEGLMTAAGWYAGTAGFVVDGDRLKTRPRGVAADHPLLELLRHRTLTAERQYGARAGCPRPKHWRGSRRTGGPTRR